MSYHVYLFRKEVKEKTSGPDFLENEELIVPFTEEQFEKLKKRLLAYGFQIESEDADSIGFNFKGGLFGISAFLRKSQLSFISGLSEEGIFEICMTAAEFTDSEEFAVFNPQEGKWEEL